VHATIKLYDQSDLLMGTYTHTFDLGDVSLDDESYDPTRDWYVHEITIP